MLLMLLLLLLCVWCCCGCRCCIGQHLDGQPAAVRISQALSGTGIELLACSSGQMAPVVHVLHDVYMQTVSKQSAHTCVFKQTQVLVKLYNAV